MIDTNEERLKLIWCEESLKGLATLTEIFKSGYLEQDYWDKSPIQAHQDTRQICQTIISSLNGIATELANIGHSLDDKEFIAA